VFGAADPYLNRRVAERLHELLPTSELFLLAAAVLAHRGTLQLPLVILVAIFSNCASAQVYYMIARARGRAWLEARFGQHAGYQKLVGWMATTETGCCF
jgi:membrane protein DedA with SNARE-associated domain